MMVHKLLLSVFLVSCVRIAQISGQDCVPLPIENITISLDAELSWERNANDSCAVSYYLVYIDTPQNNEYFYAIANTRLSITFLPVCYDYIFRIIPISTENLQGAERRLAAKIPLPANANLTVAFLKATSLEDETILLEWDLEEQWARCPDHYRVVIDDQDVDYLQDIYTYNNFLPVTNLAPCTSYAFGVMAIYNWDIEGPITVVQYSSPPLAIVPPQLSNLALGNTYVNMTWQLEPYVRNKCAVTEVYVEVADVAENFNLTLPVLDQTNRQPLTVALSNLRPDNLYFVNTTVINVAGRSEPVIVAVQTRP